MGRKWEKVGRWFGGGERSEGEYREWRIEDGFGRGLEGNNEVWNAEFGVRSAELGKEEGLKSHFHGGGIVVEFVLCETGNSF